MGPVVIARNGAPRTSTGNGCCSLDQRFSTGRIARHSLYAITCSDPRERPSLLNIPIVAVGFGYAAGQFSRCGSCTTTDGMLCRCGGR
jgi:hypothetical protein